MPLSPAQVSSRKVEANIKNVRTNGHKWNLLVQETIISVIQHRLDFGDCSAAGRLIDAMPNSSRRGLVVKYFQKYSDIRIDKTSDGFVSKLRKSEDKAYNAPNIDGANADPWFLSKDEDKELKAALDLVSARGAFYGIIKKMETELQKKNDDGTFVIANDTERQGIDNMLTSVRLALMPTANAEAA